MFQSYVKGSCVAPVRVASLPRLVHGVRNGRGATRVREQISEAAQRSLPQSCRKGTAVGTAMIQLVALVSALAPPQLASTRRALLTNAAAAVTFSVPFAAHAKGVVEGDFIKDINAAANGFKDNPVGDAAIYTPKARIDGGVYNR